MTNYYLPDSNIARSNLVLSNTSKRVRRRTRSSNIQLINIIVTTRRRRGGQVTTSFLSFVSLDDLDVIADDQDRAYSYKECHFLDFSRKSRSTVQL